MSSRWTRLVLVLLFVLSLQTTLFAELRPFGVAVQVMLLFVVVSGALNGVATGALTGLIAGMMYDFILSSPIGLTSLTFGLVGATSGLLVYFFREPTWWMRLIAVGLVSLLGEMCFPLAQAVVGLDGWLQPRIIKVAIVVALFNLALSPLAIVVCRWTLAERKVSI